ncbi:MAG: DNA replication/repair protein RecF [Xanthomonadaceae bacterium]|nr:DNA replication/repair protein RecF [Xanthomonadaceae bacterium]
MQLTRLHIENLRNIAALELALAPGLNVFIGANGAGKSSILEAAFLLSHAQSFRAGSVDDLMRRGQVRMAVAATHLHKQGEKTSALIRENSRWIARNDHTEATQISTVIREVTVVCFEPGSHELISGAGRGRRGFLDWGVFHVEHAFLAAAKRYRRVLHQRNAALKRAAGDHELDVWDSELARAAEPMERMRRDYFARFAPRLVETLGQFLRELGDSTIEWEYGWSETIGLQEVLMQRRAQDRMRGHTSRGPHRADWTIRFARAPQRVHLSRGQEKLCALACILAQARVHADACGEWPVIALDDFGSELDLDHQHRILEWLRQGCEQVLISGVEVPDALRHESSAARVFHVEHGGLRGLL